MGAARGEVVKYEANCGMAKTKRGTYLTELRIQNIKSFKGERRLSLCDAAGNLSRWTLILGDNGVGKTTLLQCLAHLAPFRNSLDEDEAKPAGGKTKRAKPQKFFLEPTGSESVRVIEELARNGEQTIKLAASFVAQGVLDRPVTKESKSFDTSIALTRRASKTLTFNASSSRDVVGRDTLVLGYGAGRKRGKGTLDSLAAAGPLDSLFSEDALLCDAEELIQQLDYAALRRKTARAKRQHEVMVRMIAELLPDVGEPSNIVVHGPSPLTAGGKTGVHAKTPYGEVPLEKLSFGYQTMTAWLADIGWRLFRHYPDSANPLCEPAIVLVDEIDLHLHPRWQRQLHDRLEQHFPAVQFVATAHSPLMAQAFISGNLAVVRRDGDHVDVLNEPNVVAGWRLDEVITSELFGLQSPYSPDVEKLLVDQAALVAKPGRSAADEALLAELTGRVLDLPKERLPEDNRAMDIIRRAAAALQPNDAE